MNKASAQVLCLFVLSLDDDAICDAIEEVVSGYGIAIEAVYEAFRALENKGAFGVSLQTKIVNYNDDLPMEAYVEEFIDGEDPLEPSDLD